MFKFALILSALVLCSANPAKKGDLLSETFEVEYLSPNDPAAQNPDTVNYEVEYLDDKKRPTHNGKNDETVSFEVEHLSPYDPAAQNPDTVSYEVEYLDDKKRPTHNGKNDETVSFDVEHLSPNDPAVQNPDTVSYEVEYLDNKKHQRQKNRVKNLRNLWNPMNPRRRPKILIGTNFINSSKK